MSAATEALDPADRPVPIRRREDLVVAPILGGQSPRWTLKDPLRLQYFSLRFVEYFVWRQLDGQTSLREIEQRFFAQFAPERLHSGQLLQFIHQLGRQGLTLHDQAGVSAVSAAQARADQSQERRNAWRNLLAIRFPGVDPDAWLNRVAPWTTWLFAPATLCVALLLILSALGLAIMDSERITRELPRVDQFFRGDRLLWMLAALAGVKILHELGHAIAAKRVGAECHELGLMLLVFTPCLYCNVSDVWLLPSRWRRLLVSGAGILVELVLAALATFIWWGSAPGLVQSLALWVMLMCSVNTLLLNGNPLLRYDGYYLLSDLLDLPNLRSRARRAGRSLLRGWLTGEKRRATGSDGWLAAYGAASWLYGWLIVYGIAWMFYRWAGRADLEQLVVVAVIAWTLWKLCRFARGTMTAFQELRTTNAFAAFRAASLSLTGLGLAAVLFWWPAPQRLACVGVLRPDRPLPVVVTTPGMLHFPAPLRPGQRVAAGQPLAQLHNPELQQELLRWQGEVHRLQRRLELLRSGQTVDSGLTAQIPTAEALLADYQQRWRARRSEAELLVLTAPATGIVLEAAADRPPMSSHPLRREGSVCDPQRTGAWLEAGELLCEIAPLESFVAVLLIDAAEAPHTPVGARVRVAMQEGGVVLEGVLEEISARPLEQLPLEVAAAQLTPSLVGVDGTGKPPRALHEARVRLLTPPVDATLHQPLRATVSLPREAIARRLWRQIQRALPGWF